MKQQGYSGVIARPCSRWKTTHPKGIRRQGGRSSQKRYVFVCPFVLFHSRDKETDEFVVGKERPRIFVAAFLLGKLHTQL